MGKYFANETLDALWARLVARVEELTGITDIFYPAGTILVENAALGWVDDSNGVGAPQPVTSASLAYPVQAGKKYLLNNVEITIPASGTYGYNNGTSYFGIENNIICEGKSMGGAISGTTYYTLIAAEDVVVPHTGLRQLYRALAAFFHLNPLASWTGISSRDYAGNTIAEYFTALAAVLRSACSSDITTLETMVTALEQYSPSPEEPEEDENGFISNPDGSYTLNTIQYQEGDTAVIIPGEYNDRPVTKLTATNLQGNTTITSIIIGEGIKEISASVFANCNNVAFLALPNTLETIGAGAFTDLWYVETLVVPASVTSIGAGAFAGMERLSSIEVEEANTMYYSKGNCLITKAEEHRTLVLGCNNSVIPQEDNIQIIGNNAFEDCKYGLTQLRIPSTVHTIGSYAFDDCKDIVWMTIPASVEIKAYAFKGCTGLTNIYYEGASIDEWNQNVRIYVEKDHNSNHLLLRVKKACQGDWEWTSEDTPTITNSSAKAFLFTAVCDDDGYLDVPTENLMLGTMEVWEWWKNYFQYGIELNKRYYIDNTIFTAAVTGVEGHVLMPEGTSIMAADGQQYTIYDGGPAPKVRDSNFNYPNSVTFYAAPANITVDNDPLMPTVYNYSTAPATINVYINKNLVDSINVMTDGDAIIQYYTYIDDPVEHITYECELRVQETGFPEYVLTASQMYCYNGMWTAGEAKPSFEIYAVTSIGDLPIDLYTPTTATLYYTVDGESKPNSTRIFNAGWYEGPSPGAPCSELIPDPVVGQRYDIAGSLFAEGFDPIYSYISIQQTEDLTWVIYNSHSGDSHEEI